MFTGSEKPIEHRGIVERITAHSVIIKIISESACSACHAKGSCIITDMQDKEIEVQQTDGNFIPGEQVNLVMSQSQGTEAVIIAYFLPFIVIFSGLILFISLGISELYSGLLALSLLFPYYLAVYLFRQRIRRHFRFYIQKIS
jgi:sigma-E factor negative regulatory protein RseC